MDWKYAPWRSHPVLRAIRPSADETFEAVLPSRKTVSIPSKNWIVRHYYRHDCKVESDVAILENGQVLVINTGHAWMLVEVFIDVEEFMRLADPKELRHKVARMLGPDPKSRRFRLRDWFSPPQKQQAQELTRQ